MKIQQVYRKTNLTERTVRFYIEKGLIQPQAEEINGRMNYNFTGADVDMLLNISALRKTGFSIEDILKIKQHPEKTCAILNAHIDRLKDDSKSLLEVISVLEPFRKRSFGGIEELGKAIHQTSARLPLPAIDVRPNFSRFDHETEEEKLKGIADFEAEQKQRYTVGKSIIITIAVVNILGSIISCFIQLNLINLLIAIILSCALLSGVSWVRYLFAIGSALNVMSILYILFGNGAIGKISTGGVVLVLANLAFSAASSIVLFASKSVGDYMYVRKNG